ncbi:MAG: hypothetical protein ACRC3B_19290 [Bacteroidia bacterium]
MSKKETLANSSDSPTGSANNNQITNNFNPSVNINPTINVTTSTPVNVKTEQGKESAASRGSKSNPMKRILIAVIIGVTISVVGYFIKRSFSKNEGSFQEELHQPVENAIKTN